MDEQQSFLAGLREGFLQTVEEEMVRGSCVPPGLRLPSWSLLLLLATRYLRHIASFLCLFPISLPLSCTVILHPS